MSGYPAPIFQLDCGDRVIQALASEQGLCTYVYTSGQLFVTNNARDATAYARSVHGYSFFIYIEARHLCRIPTRLVGAHATSIRALAAHLGVDIGHLDLHADTVDNPSVYFRVACAIAVGPHANAIVRIDCTRRLASLSLLVDESELVPFGPWLQRAAEGGIPNHVHNDSWRQEPTNVPVAESTPAISVRADIGLTTAGIRNVLHAHHLDLRPVSDRLLGLVPRNTAEQLFSAGITALLDEIDEDETNGADEDEEGIEL